MRQVNKEEILQNITGTQKVVNGATKVLHELINQASKAGISTVEITEAWEAGLE